jgi:hypothetical protein
MLLIKANSKNVTLLSESHGSLVDKCTSADQKLIGYAEFGNLVGLVGQGFPQI